MEQQPSAGGQPVPAKRRYAIGGRVRVLQVAAEIEADAKAIEAGLLAGLGRAPTECDRLEAELIAGLTARARRRRKVGYNDRAEQRQLQRLLAKSVFRSAPAA